MTRSSQTRTLSIRGLPWLSAALAASVLGLLALPAEAETPDTAEAVTNGPTSAASTESATSADEEMALFMAFNDALQEVYRQAPESNLLTQLASYRRLTEEFGGQTDDVDEILGSFVSWKLSAIGQIAEAHRVFDQTTTEPPPSVEGLAELRRSLEGYEATDALDALVEAAAGERAIFVNEGHHIPQHRMLTLLLLPRLRAAGFTHFAAETLSESMEELAERGHPVPKTGTYSDEPLYGELIRTALRLGFEVVKYESGGPPSKREPGQARNLAERVFAVDPEARLVVHLGYGHNRESADSAGGAGAMAFHFAAKTGIDPLTIDQTVFTERSTRDLEHPLYAELCGDHEDAAPVVLVDTSGGLWSEPGGNRDVTVCHPRTRLEQGRPTWMALGGSRKPIAIDPEFCGEVSPCLVEARWHTEAANAIPADRIEVRTDAPRPVLLLPEGRFRIEASSVEGESLGVTEVLVPGE